MQREHFSNWGLNGEEVGKCAFFNGQLTISRNRQEIRPKLLLITNRKWHGLRSFRLNKNSRHWMTLKVTDNQYGLNQYIIIQTTARLIVCLCDNCVVDLLLLSSKSSVTELRAWRRWANVQCSDDASRRPSRRGHRCCPRQVRPARISINVQSTSRWTAPPLSRRLARTDRGGAAGRRSGILAVLRSTSSAATTCRRRLRSSSVCLSPDQNEGLEDRVCNYVSL